MTLLLQKVLLIGLVVPVSNTHHATYGVKKTSYRAVKGTKSAWIHAVGLAVNAWIVSFDLRIAWIVAVVAAVIWFLIYILVLQRKAR